jgi:3,4-dihydroxy-9,10-secoandrosta-1,3,5(10)-triene-9,17-dione 4,5-dioxygenase
MDIRGMGYAIIGSADMARWRRFGVDMLGLMPIEGENDTLYLKMDERHFRYAIVPHGSEAYLATGWELPTKAAFDEAENELKARGIEFSHGSAEEVALRKVQQFLRVSDPAGNRHELFWGAISDHEPCISPIGVSGFVTGALGMGHVVLNAPAAFDATDEFLTQVLGFALSDLVNFNMGPDVPPVRIRFYHCNNPRQHSVAIVEMPNPAGADHVLVEVKSFDDVGRGLYRAEDMKIPLQVTLGKHINDQMVSFYMYSPTGFTVEYGHGGRQIEDWSQEPVFEATRGSLWGHRFVAPPQAPKA